MDNKINLSQLAERMAQEAGMSKAAAEQFVKNFFDIISQNVLTEGIVKVKGFGTFKLIQMEDRESVNVNTGERFTIEGHQKIAFIPDADLKERVNKPFAAFETVPITEEQAAELGVTEDNPDSSDEFKPKTTDNMEKTEKENESKKELKESKKGCEDKEGGKNVFMRVIIWVLSCLLVLALIIFLLWPVIGGSVLKKADKEIREKTPAAAVVKTQTKKKASSTAVKTDTKKKAASTAAKTDTKKKAASTAAKTDTKKAATAAQPQKESAKFTLTKADQNKDLSLFTVADTVNYKIAGTMTVHTMAKGDMLTTIALKYYGTKKLWPYIAKYNNIKSRSFNNLPVGYKIKVPTLVNK